MSLSPVSTDINAEIDMSSMEEHKTPSYTTAPTHTLSGRDDDTKSLTLAETSDVATQNYSKRPD